MDPSRDADRILAEAEEDKGLDARHVVEEAMSEFLSFDFISKPINEYTFSSCSNEKLPEMFEMYDCAKVLFARIDFLFFQPSSKNLA